MKKKILALCMIFSISLCMTGCGDSDVTVNVENSDSIYNTVFGESALIEIGDKLYYDSTTHIVYWWNGCIYGQTATTPSPYYAPNGYPYKYNPETNTFEEILKGE